MEKAKAGTGTWILIIIAVLGFFLTAAGIIWNASNLSSNLEGNCREDAKIHPIAEANEKTIISMKKDIETTQKDIGRIAASQENIAAAQKEILRRLPTP